MAYVTLTELQERYGQKMLIDLTDRSMPPAGVINLDTIDQAIGDADALIDGYLANRYALPVGEIPPLLERIAARIVIHDLHVYAPPDHIEKAFEGALKQLREIADGKLRLPIAGVTAKPSGQTGARLTDRDRPMTEQKLGGFI
jgi:phage gp36-like protein